MTEPTPRLPDVDGARIRIRRAHDGDGEGLVQIQVDERVRRYLGGARPEAGVRAAVEAKGAAALLSGAGQYVVALRALDEMLGLLTLDRRGLDLPGHVREAGNELELSYVFRPAAWGWGYAGEAISSLLGCAAVELPDQPVLVVTQTANRASLRLARRLGVVVVDAFHQFGAEQTLASAPLNSFRRSFRPG